MADIESFDGWFTRLKRQAVEQFGYSTEAAEILDEKLWKEYYLDGFTPRDALKERVSAG